MRLIYKQILLFSLVVSVVGCESNASKTEKREFRALERAFIQISESPETDWLFQLDEIKKQQLSTQRLRETKQLCISAFEATGEAFASLHLTKQKVATIETLVKKQKGDASIDDKISLLEQHKAATLATMNISKALDDAEELVKKCEKKRHILRKHFSSH